MNDFLKAIKEDFASNEKQAGDVTGFILVTFHGDVGYMLSVAASADDGDAQDLIDDVADILGYNEEGGTLQ